MTPPWLPSAWTSARHWPPRAGTSPSTSPSAPSPSPLTPGGGEKVTSPEKVKKRPSPSTQGRNLRRKIEFQTKKVEENKESETNNDLDATSQKSNPFKCEQCENIF